MIGNTPCVNCEHYMGHGRCSAYPGGIPVEIRNGADHDELRGDEVDGLTFLLNPDRTDEEAARRKLAAFLAAP